MLNLNEFNICTVYPSEAISYQGSECFNANLGGDKGILWDGLLLSRLRATICICSSVAYGLFERGVRLVSGQHIVSTYPVSPGTSVGTLILQNITATNYYHYKRKTRILLFLVSLSIGICQLFTFSSSSVDTPLGGVYDVVIFLSFIF
jgi:hypothetical protein